MGSSGSTSTSSKTTVRYAKYIEEHHEDFLNIVADYRDAIIDDSPLANYEEILVDVGFFGAGYTLASFPSLYDMFGKFMAGLDIDTLFTQIFADTVNGPEVDNLVSAEGALMDDDIETNILPRFELGMRDINSVMSSSYVVGKSIIEDGRDKQLEKFSAELRYRLIPVATQNYQLHLEWNKGAILTYAEIMKLYFLSKKEITEFNYEMLSQDKLWPFTVLDFDRAAIGALQGATSTKSNAGSGSKVGSALGGALAGAAAGSMLPIPGGTIIGGLIGLAGGLF